MSYYTKFGDVESLLTTTTTASVLASTDSVLAWDPVQAKPYQATAGAISGIGIVTSATSATTGTNISNYGVTQLTATTTAFNWLLALPTSIGLYKTIFQTSTTSTANLVTTASTASATFSATGASSGTSINGTSITFTQAGAYVELVSLSTSQWAVIGRSAAGVVCT